MGPMLCFCAVLVLVICILEKRLAASEEDRTLRYIKNKNPKPTELSHYYRVDLMQEYSGGMRHNVVALFTDAELTNALSRAKKQPEDAAACR